MTPTTIMMFLAVAIFVVSYAFIISERFNKTTVALVGAGLMILLFGFMAFSGYSVFFYKQPPPVNPTVKTAIDSPKTIDSNKIFIEYAAKRRRERRRQTDSATQKAINDLNTQKDGTKPDSSATDTTNKPGNN